VQVERKDAPARTDGWRYWQAVGLLAVLIFAWGGNYTWIKLALRDIGPWTFNAVRFCAASLVIGVFLALRHGAHQVIPPSGERVSLAIIGILQGAILTAMLTLSLVWIESTHTILLMYTNPVWTLLLSALILGERLTAVSVAGVALGIIGIGFLTNPVAMPWDAATVPGVACAFAATLGWALAAVLYRRTTWRSTFWQQVFWQLAVSAIAMTVVAVLVEAHHPIRPTASLAVIMIYNVLVPTALAYWCWAQALSRVKASTASQIMLISPVFGVAQSHVVLGEPLSAAVIASAVCVISGACLTFWRRE